MDPPSSGTARVVDTPSSEQESLGIRTFHPDQADQTVAVDRNAEELTHDVTDVIFQTVIRESPANVALKEQATKLEADLETAKGEMELAALKEEELHSRLKQAQSASEELRQQVKTLNQQLEDADSRAELNVLLSLTPVSFASLFSILESFMTAARVQLLLLALLLAGHAPNFSPPWCGMQARASWRPWHVSSRIARRSQEKPAPPDSAKGMVLQAAESVMKAYADGLSRQSVQLMLGRSDGRDLLRPLHKRFKVLLVLPCETCESLDLMMLGPHAKAFMSGMKSRLVVMLNSEDAATTFRLENRGQEMTSGGNFGKDVEVLGKFCEEFSEETYYLRLLLLSDWPVIIFRAYPHPWDVYIESLDGEVVRLEITKYEQDNGITNADKIAKIQSIDVVMLRAKVSELETEVSGLQHELSLRQASTVVPGDGEQMSQLHKSKETPLLGAAYQQISVLNTQLAHLYTELTMARTEAASIRAEKEQLEAEADGGGNAEKLAAAEAATSAAQAENTKQAGQIADLVSDIRHLQLDLEYHQQKVDQLLEDDEKQMMMKDMKSLQQEISEARQHLEEKDQLLKHQEVDLNHHRQMQQQNPGAKESDDGILDALRTEAAAKDSALIVSHYELHKEKLMRDRLEQKNLKLMERMQKLMMVVETMRKDNVNLERTLASKDRMYEEKVAQLRIIMQKLRQVQKNQKGEKPKDAVAPPVGGEVANLHLEPSTGLRTPHGPEGSVILDIAALKILASCHEGEMSLRRTCRELVLQVVLRRAMKAGGDGLDRFQLVVDEATLRVINSFLKMGDLHGEGVTSVELIEESRQPLPGLDAMYFLRPFPENVERILGEFKSAAPQHRQVHLCFTKPVEQSLLSKFTEAPHLASRVRSFVEDRGFHFDVPEAITALFPVPDPQLVSSIVQQLADVCRCLQTTTPSIRCQSDLCHTIGQRVLRELSMHQASALPSQPCLILGTLVHEYSYEACVFDLLDGNMLDGDRNVVTLKTSHAGENKDKNKEMLLEDPLWEETANKG
eukprot:g24412.t1